MSATRGDVVADWAQPLLVEQFRATIVGSFREGFLHALDLIDRLVRDDPSLTPKALAYCRQGIDQWAAEMGVNIQEDPPRRRPGLAEVQTWRDKVEGEGGGLVSKEEIADLLSLLVD